MANFVNKKGFKITVSIILAIFIAGIALSYFAKPYIEKKLSAAIQQNLPTGYELSYDTMLISLFPFGTDFLNMNIVSSNQDGNGDTTNFLNIKINTLEIRGIGLWSYFFRDQLFIEYLNVDGMASRWVGQTKNDNGGNAMTNPFKNITIKNIQISNASLRHNNSFSDSESGINIPEWNLVVHGFGFGSESTYPEYYELEMLNPSYRQESGLHSINAKRILISSSDSSMILDSLRITPLIKATQLEKYVTHEVDILDIVIPSGRVAHIDFARAIDSKKIIAGGIILDRPRFEVYKDKTLPPKPEPHKLPSEIFSKMNDWLMLDSITIKAGFIRYYELKNKGEGPGYLTFENLNAVIKGLTDNDDSMKESTIKASANLMGMGMLKADIVFPLGILKDTFSVKGSLGKMQLDQLNPMTVQVASMEILKGDSEQMVFSFRANRQFSSGTLSFYYSDLKLSFVEREKDKKGILKIIISALGNMAIYNSNPKNNKFRVGEIHFVREEPKSIFNYWWKSVFSGIESSVVIRTNKK